MKLSGRLMRRSMYVSGRMSMWSAIVLAVGAALTPLSGFAQLVDISSGPLFSGRSPHPNVAVTMSVEFPTVGAAYNGIAYRRTETYLGYFDPNQCYKYVSPGHFVPAGGVLAFHECSDKFSGNFMNWATMSAIDEFRYAMTGGNRVDENGPNGGTVLERANLPDGSLPGVSDFYASTFFPRLTVSNAVAATVLPGSFTGAAGIVNVTSCKTQVFFGTGGGGSCASPDKDIGAFTVRVNVCGATEGPARTDLCLQYGGTSGKYKPVGEGQRNAAKMRFSVFGYLMDRNPPSVGCSNPDPTTGDFGWNRCRYGGVLRAPMKYLGDKQYDTSLVASSNPKSEINIDGTLVDDPEATASTAGGRFSGFLNYINKFGSIGTYKRYDPMGEMYYEAIRYYRNLGPTPAAADPAPAAALSNATKDFFPLTTTWDDPILSRCSANYIISLSDTNANDDVYLPGYGGSPASTVRPSSRAIEAGFDAVDWTRRIGVLESSMSSLVTDDVRPGLAGLEGRNTGSTSRASYFAAGAAYWANTNDIRADLVGTQTIKTISFDVAESSPVDIHDRQLYLMGKYGGFNNTKDRAIDGAQQNPFWAADPAAPSGPAIRSNVEWDDGTGTASPADYLLASNPQKLIDGLRAAFRSLSSSSGTLSGASLTSANLTFGSAGAYIATFDPVKWSGSVLFNSLSVDPVTKLLVVSPSPIWDSGALLTARCGTVVSSSTVCTDTDTSVNKRNIVTVASVSGTRTAVNFSLTGISVDSAYLATLDKNPATGLADGLAQKRVNYLRGFRGDEAPPIGFRSRSSPMGDIINSSPIYVGPPSAAIPDGDYQPFYASNNAREPAVYVGANDGMLHAIRAATGVELFAFVPGFSASNLNDLTNPGYAHESFVDTVPKVQEAKVGGTWKTVLVGANGNGAQGVFALDVTDPTAFGLSKVLFEFSDADDADFGSVMAAPEIAKLRVGPSTGSGPPVYKYFAVVTGYNNTRIDVNGHVGADTNVSTDTLNRGVLFLLSLDHPLNTPWVLGTDYYKFKFPASAVGSPNGLGPVTLLPSRSGDRSTAAMYFGDLQGNLWRFNTAGNDPSTWTPALGTVAAPLPIFVATDSASKRQPITARPELAAGPFGSTLVFFGTGKYLGQSDVVPPPYAQQSEYALLDTGSSSVITRAGDLVARTATVSGANVSLTGSPFSYSGPSAMKGWYVDFPNTAIGERSVTKPAIRTGLLTFTTQTLSADVCGSGSGYIYQVNALTGLPYGGAPFGGYSSTVGIPGPPRIVDLTLEPGLTRATGEQINKKTQATLVSGTLGKIDTPGPVIPSKTPPVGRINWREITNWNDLTGN